MQGTEPPEVPPVGEVFRGYLRTTAFVHVLVALALVGIGLLVLFGGVIEEYQARSRGRVQRGVVRSVTPFQAYGFMPRVRVSIELQQDGASRVEEVVLTRNDAKAYRPGGPVEVYVHPERPEILVPTRAEHAPFLSGCLAAGFAGLWGLLCLSLWIEARKYVDLYRRGTRVRGSLKMMARYHGFPLWRMDFDVQGRAVGGSCLRPPSMLSEGPCLIAYDPRKPKRAVILGPWIEPAEDPDA